MNYLSDLRNLMMSAIFMGLCTLFIGLYFREIELAENHLSNGLPIGKIISAGDEVSRKPARHLLWIPLSAEKNVFAKDTIRTGPTSSTKIQISDDTSIELSPGSLVYLEFGENGLRINLASGDIFAKGRLVAKVGDSEIRTQNDGSFTATRDHHSGKVQVTSKQGQVLTKDMSSNKETLLTLEQALSTNIKGKTTVDEFLFRNLNPKNSQLLDVSSVNASIEFSWNALSSSEQNSLLENSSLKVQVAQDSRFKTILKEIEIADLSSSQIKAPVKDGVYFWRIFNHQNGKTVSNVEKFQVRIPADIHWAVSKSDEAFQAKLSSKGLSFDLSWTTNKSSLLYRILVYSKDKNELLGAIDAGSKTRLIWNQENHTLVDKIRERALLEDTFTLELLALDENRKLIFPEGLRTQLRVQDDRRPSAPSQFRAMLDASNPYMTNITWENQSNSLSTFEIQTGTKIFKQAGNHFQIKTQEFLAMLKRNEKISIRSVNDKNLRSDTVFLTPKAKEFAIFDALENTPKLFYPPLGRVLSKKASRSIDFMWQEAGSENIRPKYYEIQIKELNSGRPLQVFQAPRNSLQVPLNMPNGRYTWSVKAVWPYPSIAPTFSDDRTFEVKGFRLDAPVLRQPAQKR